MDFAQDGDLSRYDAEDIADGAMWEGDAQKFLGALIQAGFVDQDEHGIYLHDWYDYAGKLIERRKADAERKRKERSKKSAPKDSETCPQDVHRTSKRQRTESIVNLTKPNLTKPEQISGGGDDNTRARVEDHMPESETTEPIDDDLAAVVHEFEACGYGTLHERVLDHLADLLDTYGREWVVNALREGMRQGRRSLAYVNGILQRWQSRGGMTLGPPEDGQGQTRPGGEKRGRAQKRDQPGCANIDFDLNQLSL